MDTRTSSPAFGAGLVLMAAVLWGTVGPAQVLAAGPMTPTALGGWRLVVGGLVLGLLTTRRLSTLRVLTEGRVLRPLLVCAVSTGVYQAAFLSSVSRTGAALATVIALGTAPAAIGVCARWVAGERMSAAWAVGTVAAVAGCALLLAPGNGARVDSLGLLLAVAAGACYGLYTAGLVRVKATTAGTLSLAEPLAAALIGVLLLHEHLSLLAWAGCALILAGMIATCLPAMPRGRLSARATEFRPDRRITFAKRALDAPPLEQDAVASTTSRTSA